MGIMFIITTYNNDDDDNNNSTSEASITRRAEGNGAPTNDDGDGDVVGSNDY